MSSIVILTGNHLCHNPRVIKEASALADGGHRVEILGGWYDVELKRRDLELMTDLKLTFTPVIDLTGQSSAGRLAFRVQGKLASLAHSKLDWESGRQLGYAGTALARAVTTRKPDLMIAHSEQALWAAAQLPSDGPVLGVDMEDWFSEDLLPEARRHRPLKLLRSLETKLLREGRHTTCPSQAMANALGAEYACRPPAVIYNAFPWADRKTLDGKTRDRRDPTLPSIHWYSQTLGYGRGLEDLLEALPHIKHPAEIHLRGNPVAGFESWLQDRLPESWRPHVFIHRLVSNDELLSRIAEHDIGFAGEMNYCRSRDLTVTNKILHYLLGGLAVVASDTAGQREIAQQAGEAVTLYRSGDSTSLAAALNALLSSTEHLAEAKSAALAAAKKTFSWERQVPVLLSNVNHALAS